MIGWGLVDGELMPKLAESVWNFLPRGWWTRAGSTPFIVFVPSWVLMVATWYMVIQNARAPVIGVVLLRLQLVVLGLVATAMWPIFLILLAAAKYGKLI